MYTVEPADSRMCYFSIEFNKFELDGITGYYDDMCKKDFFQLPDGHRICSNYTGRSKLIVSFFNEKLIVTLSFYQN